MITQSLHVLLAEDDQAVADLVLEQLKQSKSIQARTTHLRSLAETLDFLRNDLPDIILIDSSLPDSQGTATFDVIQEQADSVPVVVLDSFDAKQTGIDSIHSGAQGYINKENITAARLECSLYHALERNRIELELRDIKSRYNRITGAITNYIYSVRVDNGQPVETIHNPACEAVTGYTPEEFASDPSLWINMVPVEDHHLIQNQIKRIFRDKKVEPVEHRIIRKDGSVRWTSNTPVPFYDSKGSLISYDGVICDISERKHAEIKLHKAYDELELRIDERTAELQAANIQLQQEIRDRRQFEDALRESEEFSRSIIDSSKDCIKLLDLKGRLLYMSKGGQELLEIKDINSYLHKAWINLWDKETRKEARKTVKKATSGNTASFQGYFPTEKGTRKYWDIIVSPMFDKNGKVECLLAISRDITKYKEAEEALREAKTSAERAGQAKSEFLANMSHEIRTPMNAIIGMTNLALQQKVPGKVRKYLEVVRTTSDSLLGIINDILDFSKIESDKLNIENIQFSLHDILAKLIEMFDQKASETGIQLSIDTKNDVPDLLVGDPLRLGQVLLNLVSNAIKFTQKGEVAINITCLKKSSAKTQLQFSVTDTGIGIAKDKIGIVFNAFEQADGTTTRKHGGTGLGLSISKKLVNLMGGDIRLKSALGKGSTFTFTVPFGYQSVTSRFVNPAHFTCKKTLPLKTNLPKGLRILLVEDNAFNQMLAQEVLEDAGISVQVANNGKQALAVLNKQNFDAILMDIQMPEMDGFEATGLIRKRKKLAKIPIIAMTAHAMRGDRQKCIDAGMDDYLTKPFQPEEIYAVLARFTGKKRTSRDKDSVFREEECHEAIGDIDLACIRSHLQNTYRFDSEKIETILEAAKCSLVEQLAMGDDALKQGDLKTLSRVAHTIKGILRNLGLDKAASLAERIEKQQARAADENYISALKEQFVVLNEVFSSLFD